MNLTSKLNLISELLDVCREFIENNIDENDLIDKCESKKIISKLYICHLGQILRN
jgi:hypothetical protein